MCSASGIVYAHRNEHIVNYGPDTQDRGEPSEVYNDDLPSQSNIPHRGKRKLDSGRENEKPSSMMRKKNQYSLLANFMGMKEIEFSKWLLSAAPAERAKVLRDFKKRKEQKRSNN